MQIILVIISIIVGLFILYLLFIQFYKIGQILKQKYPIIFRVYMIFWILILALSVFGVLVGVSDLIENRKIKSEQDKIKQITQSIDSSYSIEEPIIKPLNKNHTNLNDMTEQQRVQGYVKELQQAGVPDDVIYQKLTQSKKLPQFQAIRASSGDDVMARSLGLKLNPLYWTTTQDVQKRIASARQAGYSDAEIFKAIKESNRYKHEFNKGVSDKDISQSLGLNINK